MRQSKSLSQHTECWRDVAPTTTGSQRLSTRAVCACMPKLVFPCVFQPPPFFSDCSAQFSPAQHSTAHLLFSSLCCLPYSSPRLPLPRTQPQEVYVDDESKLTLHGLVQHYIMLNESDKNKKLTDLLDALDFNQVVIFVKSVPRAKELNKLLNDCNFPSVAMHGSMSQVRGTGEDHILLSHADVCARSSEVIYF